MLVIFPLLTVFSLFKNADSEVGISMMGNKHKHSTLFCILQVLFCFFCFFASPTFSKF